MARRVLLLGTTGVAKDVVVERLREELHHSAHADHFEARDFERDYVLPGFDDLPDFLDSDEPRQREGVRSAWERLRIEFPPDRTDDLVLSMHGVLVRELYGVRSLVNIDEIRAFEPTQVITVIDDVYLKWWKTEARAGGLGYIGRPTLLQLLDGRHAEMLIGDLICRNTDPHGPRPLMNWLMAARHPACLVARLVFGDPNELVPIYLSFPISEPRRMQAADGDQSGIEQVNQFLREATDFERSHQRVVNFCPLSIDELPMLNVARLDLDESALVPFRPGEQRWNVTSYYGAAETLMAEDLPEEIPLVNGQVIECIGMVGGDVAVRDYRLVAQCRRLVVFNPVFNGRLSSGVDNEIRYAMNLRKPIHIFQDPKHDPDDLARQHLIGAVGALGSRPLSNRINFHPSVQAALEAASI